MYDEKTLSANLAVLAARTPDLAEKVRRAEIPRYLAPLAARNGMITAEIEAPGGRGTLHSKYDPQKEADKFAEGKQIGTKNDYVLMGLGLGYAAEAVLRRLQPHQNLVVIEADAAMLRAALALRDLRDLLGAKNVSLFCCDDPVAFSVEINAFFNEFFREDIQYLFYPPALRMSAETYENAATEIRNAANRRRIDIGTSIKIGAMCQSNLTKNALAYMLSPGVKRVRDALKSRPAIVVAAGPSLDCNMALLAEAREKALIIAVGTVFKKLLAAGIRPHIVVAMDPGELSARYFEDLPTVDDVFLAADPEICPLILADYPGPRVIFDVKTPIVNWLRSMSAPKGELEKGRTVAHTSYFLARYLGADPIIFVGLDLSFTDNKAHAEGCDNAWGADIGEEIARNIEEVRGEDGKVAMRRIADAEDGIVLIPGVDGGMVPTRRNFLNFLTIFENRFAVEDRRIIDATEGGALKRGAEIMTLREALDTCATKRFDALEILRARLGEPDSVDIAGFAREVEKILAALARIRRSAEEGAEALKKLERIIDEREHDSPQVVKLLKAANVCNDAIITEVPTVSFVQRTMMETKILFERPDLAGVANMPPGRERVKKEMLRTALFFNDTAESARQLAELFRELRDYLGSDAARAEVARCGARA